MNIGSNPVISAVRITNNTSQVASHKVADAADRAMMRSNSITEQKSTPGVQYHPQSVEKQELTYSSDGNVDTLKPIVLGTSRNHEKATEAFEDLNHTMRSGRRKFEKFKQNLQHIAPDLAALKFGFTMDAKGGLVITGVADFDKKEQLEKIINQDDGLKKWAKSAFDSMTDYLKAEGTSTKIGSYSLNMENFHKTIDLGKALNLEKNPSFLASNDFFLSQLIQKGTRLSPAERI